MPAVNPADLRVTRWDLLASAGTTRSLRFVSPDLVLGSVSVWTGGDVSDVDDLAGATEHPGVVSGGGSVATVDLAVPTGGGVPLRLTVNGVVVTVGTLTPSSTGAVSPDTDLTLRLGDAVVSLSVLGAGSVQSVGAGQGVSVDGSDPANPVVSAEVTQAGVDTAISAAIAALVDSSPAALDTLNELAAALGDDPNFATTLTNALAEKIAAATLTTDDDLLTRAGGVPARLTRADLAADPAFSEAYAPLGSTALAFVDGYDDIPAPSVDNQGQQWFVRNLNGGTMYGSDGANIVQLAGSVGEPPAFALSDYGTVTVHLDASELIGLADNDPVAQWDDLSGNAYHAVQAIGTAQPAYRTGVLNGLPVVRFDGTSDYLRTALFSAALAQPNLIVGLFKPTLGSVGGVFSGRDDVIHNLGLLIDGRVNMAAPTSRTLTTTASGAFQIVAAYFNGASSRLWLGGGAGEPMADIGANGLNGLTIGTNHVVTPSAFQPIDVAEVAVLNAVSGTLVDAVNAIGEHLADKWGVAWSTAS